MKKASIKAKLIILFILIKIIPLLIISYIAITGVLLLEKHFAKNTLEVFHNNKQIIKNTANRAIDDSIQMLDKKSQISLEKLSLQIANHISEFLYERDKDILFLSQLPLNKKTLESFFKNKQKGITIHDDYHYDESLSKWVANVSHEKKSEHITSSLQDNNKEFHYTSLEPLKSKMIPIYKEVVYFDLNGKETLKVSTISSKKKDVSQQKNTYIKAENYFNHIQKLKQGEIYVSSVIGEYVFSNVIGDFTKAKAKKMGIKFEPEKYAYAGVENPVGKKFQGIVRFITPKYEKGQKVGYISLALDHRHIMEFTDTVNPTQSNMKQDIANASTGNYAFMWDFKGRNISHPRDYFIYGYDANTGKPVTPWLSADINEKFVQSKQTDINAFLNHYPTFEAQSLKKKPNLKQLKEKGNIALDCRYLNFAPQCTGWMELTKDGGYGSFIIYWSNVWKLTTAATIPYYTGQYQNSKRGFGFVTIGANVDEFHSAAMKTKDNVDLILNQQTKTMQQNLEMNKINIKQYINDIINELSVLTVFMIIIVIVIAILLSNYISKKIYNLLIATKKFSNSQYDYKIEVTSNDEIGQLEHSFNEMTSKVSFLIKQQDELNEILEKKVLKAIEKTKENERTIREKDNILAQQSKMAAMGEMLENIAHQWRQPLSVISTASSGLKIKNKMGMLKEAEMESILDDITNSTQYLSRTIDDFRNFFRTDKELKTFFINESIEKTLNIIHSKFENSQIQIIKELEKVQINSYENELIQVLINLFNNSKDEFIEKNISERLIFIKLYRKDDFVYIQTKDSAFGIKKDILNRVFEPYFTTKHKTQGTGIGLHMSREIITKHMNGTISVENVQFTYKKKKYSGAEFTIKIPLT